MPALRISELIFEKRYNKPAMGSFFKHTLNKGALPDWNFGMPAQWQKGFLDFNNRGGFRLC